LQRIADMAKTSPALATPLREHLEKLAAFAPQEGLPVLSLYLNLAADQHGRDSYDPFMRKVLAERQGAFRTGSPERASFDRDVDRIHAYLAAEVNRSSNGLAIFACAGAKDFFDAIQLQVPVGEHALFVGSTPHLYPLARLVDQYPRYAAVVLDTSRARIFVLSLGAVERRDEIISDRMRRTSMGGWSQARYQRHADNWHLLHVKDVVEALDRIVREEHIPQVIVAGDEVVVPILKEHLPQRLLDRLVEVVPLEKEVSEDKLLRTTLEILREKDAANDVERVQEVVGAWQGSGLGVVGPEATLQALTLGQVDELLISGTAAALRPVALPPDSPRGAITAATSAPAGAGDGDRVKLAGELVKRAEQTGALVRFIEDPQLLEPFGGVAASLRFRV
jgi:peptide subunit release factor 1 (eRF1)